jgi:CRISPR-associated endoribonuclease Cas6
MKEIITFCSIGTNKVVLPIQYNHLVQAMIYELLDEELATFLHEEGFENKRRVFKMFTFSRILGKYILDRKGEKIKFNQSIKLIISSPFSEFSNSIGNSFLNRQKVKLGNNSLEVKQLTIEKENVNKEEIKFYTLSPISTYSTLYRKDGKKFTYYFNPQEDEFSETIGNNLRNKYKAFYLKEPPEGEIKLIPIGPTKLSIVKYKGFIIKGYMGKFSMTGPIPLLQMGVDTGIGSKNSQGFGCVKII